MDTFLGISPWDFAIIWSCPSLLEKRCRKSNLRVTVSKLPLSNPLQQFCEWCFRMPHTYEWIQRILLGKSIQYYSSHPNALTRRSICDIHIPLGFGEKGLEEVNEINVVPPDQGRGGHMTHIVYTILRVFVWLIILFFASFFLGFFGRLCGRTQKSLWEISIKPSSSIKEIFWYDSIFRMLYSILL